VSDLQPADECEYKYFLIAIGDLGELVLQKIDVRFEASFWPHFDGEDVMAIPLGFLASNILCEEGFGDLRKVVERARWQGVKPPRCCVPYTRKESEAHYRVIARVEHHLVLKMTDWIGSLWCSCRR